VRTLPVMPRPGVQSGLMPRWTRHRTDDGEPGRRGEPGSEGALSPRLQRVGRAVDRSVTSRRPATGPAQHPWSTWTAVPPGSSATRTKRDADPLTAPNQHWPLPQRATGKSSFAAGRTSFAARRGVREWKSTPSGMLASGSVGR
jgi:hypothetical protein